MNRIKHSLVNFFNRAKVIDRTDQRNITETICSTDGPRDCTLILDASGSMNNKDWKPSRKKGSQEAGGAFVDRLALEEPDARVAIVTYGDTADLLQTLTAVTKHNQLKKSINSIRCSGCTNITAGLEIALQLLKASQHLGHVVLLTDGWHNAGPNPKYISDELKRYAIIDCVGIGGSPADVDEKLLKYIASPYPDGSKRYRWIGDKERLIRHFHNLAGRISRA